MFKMISVEVQKQGTRDRIIAKKILAPRLGNFSVTSRCNIDFTISLT